MVFVTTPDGLGRDVHKNDIRDCLFGDVLTEFTKDKDIIVVTNYPVGIVGTVGKDNCLVQFNNSGRDFLFENIRKITGNINISLQYRRID